MTRASQDPTRDDVTRAARLHAAALGYRLLQVTGVIEDPPCGATFLVRLTGAHRHRLGILVLALEYYPASGWAVVEEHDDEIWNRDANQERECAYCSRTVAADRIINRVCRDCYHAGIEV